MNVIVDINDIISLILPIEEYLKEKAKTNNDSVDAEIMNDYSYTLHLIAEKLATV